jgi:branched-chain amino acid transport system permease protein
MDDLASWLIQGVPIGCIYGLVAVGLVLTYKTSGVFNLAFAGQAFFCAWFWYDLVENNGWPNWLGFLVTVFVVAPLVGVLLDRALFRWMRGTSWQVKLVSALGLLVGIPELVKVIYSSTPAEFPPTLAGFIGMERGDSWEPFGYFIGADAIIVIIFTLVAVAVLGYIFRFTAIGLQMRAVVESPRMVELAGVDSDRVSTVAWMLSSTMAGLAGILLSGVYRQVNGTAYTLVIIAAIAAASIGRFQSIPAALIGAIGIGVVARALPDILGGGNFDDVQPSLPFVVLFVLLVFWGKLRSGRAATDPLAGVDPPPPAMAHEYKDAAMQKASRVGFLMFIAIFLVVMGVPGFVSSLWVDRLTAVFVFAVIFLSITIFTGLGGQISLAQATFASVGAFTLANLFRDEGWPAIPAWIAGALLAAAVGMVFVVLIDLLPEWVGRLTGRRPTRLAGLNLALATLAFGLMMDKLVFSKEKIIGGDSGLQISRPDWLKNDHRWFFAVFVVYALVAYMVILIRRGTTGRYLAALRGSDAAAASVGINATGQRVKLFAFSAFVAGLGGGLLTLHAENASPRDTISFVGLVWVVLVVTLGSRTVDGATNAAIGFIVFTWLVGALGFPEEIAVMLFGFGAIQYARHPEGIVEFQTRKGVLSTQRQRALNTRAKEMMKDGRLPAPFLHGWKAWAPVFAGPLLYFMYVLVRSAIEDPWVHVHGDTLLLFIGPSLLYGLAWMVRTEWALERIGAWKLGLVVMAGGTAAGAGLGAFFDDQGWPLHHNLRDNMLVGAAAGLAAVGFILLPLQIRRIGTQRGWLTAPIAWSAGIAPTFFIIIGALLFQRTTLTGSSGGNVFNSGFPPEGWPVFFLVSLWVLAWTQWVGGVQGAANELAIGGENFQPPEEKAYVAPREMAAAATPAGGAT